VYIAFFDSGLGGLNTLKQALADLPDENYIYFGDTAHVPYGTKSPAEVCRLMEQTLHTLSAYDLKALVLACNTATSAAAPFLRSRYSFPVIGMEPAIKPAVELCRQSGRRVLLLATILTLEGEKIANLKGRVDTDNLVDGLAASELVDLAESLNFDQKTAEDCLREKLAGYDLTRYGCVVLGCTHFNYYGEAIARVFPAGTKIMDGNIGTVRRLAEVIEYDRRAARPSVGDREILLHLSDTADKTKIKIADSILRSATTTPIRLI